MHCQSLPPGCECAEDDFLGQTPRATVQVGGTREGARPQGDTRYTVLSLSCAPRRRFLKGQWEALGD